MLTENSMTSFFEKDDKPYLYTEQSRSYVARFALECLESWGLVSSICSLFSKRTCVEYDERNVVKFAPAPTNNECFAKPNLGGLGYNNPRKHKSPL